MSKLLADDITQAMDGQDTWTFAGLINTEEHWVARALGDKELDPQLDQDLIIVLARALGYQPSRYLTKANIDDRDPELAQRRLEKAEMQAEMQARIDSGLL